MSATWVCLGCGINYEAWDPAERCAHSHLSGVLAAPTQTDHHFLEGTGRPGHGASIEWRPT